MGHGTPPFYLLLHKVTIHERLDEFNVMLMAFKHNFPDKSRARSFRSSAEPLKVHLVIEELGRTSRLPVASTMPTAGWMVLHSRDPLSSARVVKRDKRQLQNSCVAPFP